jgi:hypothetical protein
MLPASFPKAAGVFSSAASASVPAMRFFHTKQRFSKQLHGEQLL